MTPGERCGCWFILNRFPAASRRRAPGPCLARERNGGASRRPRSAGPVPLSGPGWLTGAPLAPPRNWHRSAIYHMHAAHPHRAHSSEGVHPCCRHRDRGAARAEPRDGAADCVSREGRALQRDYSPLLTVCPRYARLPALETRACFGRENGSRLTHNVCVSSRKQQLLINHSMHAHGACPCKWRVREPRHLDPTRLSPNSL